jgi:hypothetical protein
MFVELGSAIRKILSLLIVDGTLLSVTIEGREIILAFPSFSAAVIKPFKLAGVYPNRKPVLGTGKGGPTVLALPANGLPAKNLELVTTRPLNTASISVPNALENVGVVSTKFDSIKT